MTTLEDVAHKAEVSRATVSRVINNRTYVRPEVRERVLAAIRATGYVPNAAARTMVTKRTNVLSLLIPEFYSNETEGLLSFYPLVLHSISEAATRHNYSLLLSILSSGQRAHIEGGQLRAGYVDGFIGTGLLYEDAALQHLLATGKPTVLIGRNPYYPEISSIDVDHFQAAFTGVTHLIERGRRRIALSALGTRAMQDTRLREGYVRAQLQRGIPVDPRYFLSVEDSGLSAEGMVARLLSLPEPPDAFFVADDFVAAHTLEALLARGLHVPDDVALVSFGDLPVARRTSPPLTTVRQPVHALGEEAVRLLVELLAADEPAPQHRLLPVQLVPRGSS